MIGRTVGLMLEHLFSHLERAEPSKPDAARVVPAVPATAPRRDVLPTKPSKPRPPTMAERYDRLVAMMKARYGIRVRRWRTSMSGCAWEVHYRDGSISRLIESPYPKGPMSAAIFLHEVGHHAIGLGVYRPRCLEEYHAWAWSLAAMEQHGLNVTDAVRKRMADSLRYAVAKSLRRGIKALPPELEPYRSGVRCSSR